MLKKIANKKILPADLLYYRHKLLSGIGQIPILVYTMGKVGSSTVYYTLLNHNVSQLIYHIHFLSDFYLERMTVKYNEDKKDSLARLSLNQFIKGSTDHMTASNMLKKVLESGNRSKWKIITLVRDPVATFLSHIFQNPRTHRPFLLNEKGELDKKKVDAYIYEYFIQFDSEEDFISNWFDREFYSFTGIDIYGYPFDPSIGFTIIREEHFDIAVIALNNLESNLQRVISELIPENKNVKDISVFKKNIRENQDDTGFYKKLKNSIIVPTDGLKKVYSTRFATHFFSNEFRAEMIEKWAVPRNHSRYG